MKKYYLQLFNFSSQGTGNVYSIGKTPLKRGEQGHGSYISFQAKNRREANKKAKQGFSDGEVVTFLDSPKGE